MNKEAETAAARLWRDRAEIREQERNEALAQARLAEARCALLATENEHLRLELASLRAFASLDPKRTKTSEIEAEMEAVKEALVSLLAPSEPDANRPSAVRAENRQLDAGNVVEIARTRSSEMLREEPRLPRATWDFPQRM
jgi:hypothetical protein